MKTRISILILIAIACFAQESSTVVRMSQSPSDTGYQSILVYSSSLLTYRCLARSTQALTSLPTISAASNANPVSLTITAHGLDYQSGATTTPTIFISGGTGNWSAINGLWIATPTGANTVTIAVNSTAFGALAGTFTVSTRAPRTSSNVWAVQAFKYDGSNNLIWTGWASDSTGTTLPQLQGGTPSFRFACASRTSLAYQ